MKAPWTNPYFPWRLFIQIVLKQALIIIVCAIIFASVASHYFYSRAGDYMLVSDMLPLFNRTVALLTISMVVIFIVVSLWMGRNFLNPLGSIIRRATRLAEQNSKGLTASPQIPNSPGGAIGENLTDEEPGELSDLAMAIEGLRKDLEVKSAQISTEKAEVEALMSSVQEAILAVDLNENSIFYNSKFAIQFRVGGRRARTFRLGEVFRAPEVLAAFSSALKGITPHPTSVSIYFPSEGINRHFSLSVSPLRGQNISNPIYGALGIFYDITELKRAEQIRIDFVGNVSHELRTPLTAIKGYADTLRQDIEAGQHEDLTRYLDVITKNVGRLMNLVGDLLDLSSLESGGLDLKVEELKTQMITEQALAQLEAKRGAKNHQIKVQYGTPMVVADPKRVEQIIVNLVENAIKYIPSNGVIDIIWARTEMPQPGVTLRVKDNGPGISREHQDRLFERFYRVDRDRSSETGGTGLGLAIVKHIMQRHGGSIRVTSELGQGTEFTCHFPQ